VKELGDFITRFNMSITLSESLVVKKQNRYFLLNESLKKRVSKDFFYVGVYLGKVKGRAFFPSFPLLAMIAEHDANKVVVDEKTEWLFICGRDIFKQGIVNVTASKRKGDYTLVMNQRGECLGFGRILGSVDEKKDKHKVIVKNIADIGDFLRRERHRGQWT
jgi:ribosome biogenesis protein Nip4